MRSSFTPVLGRALTVVIASGIVACHDGGETRVSVQYAPRAGTDVQEFQAALQAGQVVKAFATDATATPGDVLELETPASGFVVVAVALLNAAGTVAGGATAIELRPDASFSVVVEIDSLNPSTDCAECLGAKSFALPTALQRAGVPKDSLWMVWTATSGGQAITK